MIFLKWTIWCNKCWHYTRENNLPSSFVNFLPTLPTKATQKTSGSRGRKIRRCLQLLIGVMLSVYFVSHSGTGHSSGPQQYVTLKYLYVPWHGSPPNSALLTSILQVCFPIPRHLVWNDNIKMIWLVRSHHRLTPIESCYLRFPPCNPDFSWISQHHMSSHLIFHRKHLARGSISHQDIRALKKYRLTHQVGPYF